MVVAARPVTVTRRNPRTGTMEAARELASCMYSASTTADRWQSSSEWGWYRVSASRTYGK